MTSVPTFALVKSTRPKPPSLRQMRSATVSQFGQFNSFPQPRQDLQTPDRQPPPSPPCSQPSALNTFPLPDSAPPLHTPLAGPSAGVRPDAPSVPFAGAPDGEEQIGDEDECRSETTVMAEDYSRLRFPLASAPAGAILLSSDDGVYDTLSQSQASAIEEFFSPAAIAIGVALVKYRMQIDKWEQDEQPALSVIKASFVVDVCLLRVVNVFEHVRTILDMVIHLNSSLESFRVGIHSSQLDRQDEQAGAQYAGFPLSDWLCRNSALMWLFSPSRFWHALCGLEDEARLLEDAFSNVSLEFSELCEWLDGYLTPVLAELKPSSTGASEEVGRILDVHSYLCEAMSQTTVAVQAMAHCAKKIGHSVGSFQRLFYADGKALEVGVLQKWAGSWTERFVPLAASLALLVAISNDIQSSTAGTPHAISL